MAFPEHVSVYIDESGDLGFSEKASKMFIVAYIIPHQEWALRTALRRLMKRLRGRKKFSGEELKFSRDSDFIHETVFKKIFSSRKPELEIDIGLVVIDKAAVKPKLREKQPILYNYLVAHYIVVNVLAGYSPSHLKFVVDKSMDKSSREAFNNYVGEKISWKASMEYEIAAPRTKILHVDSREEPCLQMADYIAGATFRKFEHEDSRFYDMFRHRIFFRNSWGDIIW